MLQFTDVIIRIGGRTILDGCSFAIPSQTKVGVVGRNGAGKSTLFRAITGQFDPDSGDIETSRNLRIGQVSQEMPSGSQTPVELVVDGDPERQAIRRALQSTKDESEKAEWLGRQAEIEQQRPEWQARDLLMGLGYKEEDLDHPLSSFSGGWRMRAALAAALFATPDLLLLDEPTNHLDLESSLWLEGFLKRYPYGVLVISHDRNVLNAISQHILHVHDGKTKMYRGAFDDFLRLRAEHQKQQERLQKRTEMRRKHLQSYVDRFRYKADKARQAQSRLKMLERLPVSSIETETAVQFQFAHAPMPPPPMITLDNVKAGYGDRTVLARVGLRIDPDDRIALLGRNGNGKSTLAKVIEGSLSPFEGEIVRAADVRCVMFQQHQIESLMPDQTAIEHMEQLDPNARAEVHRSRLGAFGLSGEKTKQAVKSLSGGEKTRLIFAMITLKAPHLLILDEPTNHLDMQSREALADAINQFQGAVILISHDFHLLGLTADRLLLVGDGTVKTWEDDLDAYRQFLLDEPSPEKAGARTVREDKSQPGKTRPTSQQRRVRTAELRNAIRDVEKKIKALEKEQASINQKLIDGHDDMKSLSQRASKIADGLAECEDTWLMLQEELEQLV